MDYLIVGVLQVFFSILKVFEIKWSYENKVIPLTILTLVLQLVWLLSTAIGVREVIAGDWTMGIVYAVCGGIGKIMAITLFQGNKYRKKVFDKVVGKKK